LAGRVPFALLMRDWGDRFRATAAAESLSR
jgi:hypothetical protein